MIIRFSVLAFIGKDERLSVVGSIPQLGNWNVSCAMPLFPCLPPETNLRITYWSVVVDCGDTSFEYKYIKWKRRSATPTPSPESPDDISNFHAVRYTDVTKENEFQINVLKPYLKKRYAGFPVEGDDLHWEGNGENDNRQFLDWDDEALGKVESLDFISRVRLADPDSLKHLKDLTLNIVQDSNVWVASLEIAETSNEASDETAHVVWTFLSVAPVYCLQACRFVHEMTEYELTTHYYNSIRLAQDMDWDKVLDRVYIGTCPRRLWHFSYLKTGLRISSIINFQAVEDLPANWPEVEAHPDPNSRTPSNLFKLVDEHDIDYIWLPTTDMCSFSKSKTVAHASWILQGLLANPKTTGVYVHCNAGVGRSTACVAGYMINCLGLSLRKANLLLNARRCMTYFDGPALAIGAKDYIKKFGDVKGVS